MRRNRRAQFAGRRSTTPRPCRRRSRRRVKACAPRPQAQPARWPLCRRARLGRTFAWLNSRPILTALAINTSFRHHLGISGVAAKLAGAFSGPRLILDHPGQQTMHACDEVLCGRDRLLGKVIAKAHIKIEQGEPPVRSRTVADGPGTPRHGNLTALISLGIPKLVRFVKIRPRQPDTVHMVLLYLIWPPSACSRPARRVKLTDGALAPRQRRVPWRFECKFFVALAG